MIKYDSICLEGIDKTCKDLIMAITMKLTNFKYSYISRGLISMLAYQNMYNRQTYEYSEKALEHIMFVYLTADKEDWKCRCAISTEKAIDYEKNVKAFNDVIAQLRLKHGAKFQCIEFNTSEIAVYKITKQIIENIEKLNKDSNEKI